MKYYGSDFVEYTAPQIRALRTSEPTSLFCYTRTMNCPKCNKPMSKIRSRVTSNLKTGKDLIEYNNFTHQCEDDDIWITTETPIAEKAVSNQVK